MNLTSNAEHQGLTCQTNGLDVFSPENIVRCEEHTKGIQRKLDKAVTSDDRNGKNTRMLRTVSTGQ